MHRFQTIVFNAVFGIWFIHAVLNNISSTLLKRVKANPDDDKIRDAFMMWDKAYVDGELVVVQGLKNSRKEEADLYFS